MSRKVFRRAVTETSTTLSNLGEIGDVRVEDGKKYRLVYTGTSQAAKALLALDSGDSALASYLVQVAPASTSPVFGVNDTGASIASLTYFWALVEGPYAADSTIIGTDANLSAEQQIGLNSDKRIATITTVTSDHTVHVFGQSIVSVTSVASDMGTKYVFIKGSGA